jgi:hypothetical protein
VRHSGWLNAPIEQALQCPNGHRIRDGRIVIASQVLRCQHRASRDSAPCGALLWVISMHSGAVYAAAVTQEDVLEMKAHRDIYQTLRYLGAPMWESAT